MTSVGSMPRSALSVRESDMLAVIHWEINGKTGHGEPFDARMAAVWVKEMNAKYGAGTHWLEYCNGN